ncbi:Putative uncharacterized protein, partial [Moritella viscosa]
MGGAKNPSVSVTADEDSREFQPNEPTKTNPKFNPGANAQTIIEDTKRGQLGFWENTWR